ncbi:hypothetical protein [Winogradskyella sp. 3972H.M.0a.05]|uniref:hypothetical protein n=1 Tax=Winogradskyella sp. 3972H.M.0a.05 TaxID=2950277 RepID=UPI0033984DAB
MKIKQLSLLVVFCIGFVTVCFSQHRRYRIQNNVGIMGGLTQYDIITDNFETKKGTGWMLGASATVDLPNKWYNLSYMIQLTQNPFEIETRTTGASTETTLTEYKVFTVQAGLIGHLKLVGNNITIDAGPMLQYNSNLELQDGSHENYFIQNYTNLQAKDIEDVSNFNVNGMVGATAGFDHFKVSAHYVYSFLNTLEKLNDQNLDTTGGESNFKGNQSMLIFGVAVFF